MNNLFALAKRENNPKRDFIIVNKLQSKHFPSSPSETLELFYMLGKKLSEKYPDGFTVIIGFAETAVGVASGAAYCFLDRSFILTTTRENIPEWFEHTGFEEEHSHAPSHFLCLNCIEQLKKARQVILIDDEFTTGKTAVHLFNAIKEFLSDECRVCAAAIFASESSKKLFESSGMDFVSLYNKDIITGNKFPEKFLKDTEVVPSCPEYEINVNSLLDIRIGCYVGDYYNECRKLCAQTAENIIEKFPEAKSAEIISTEEFCFPPIILGEILEKCGLKISVHSITRSPMLPSDEPDYPIKSRVKLKSLYDKNRTVYLYNICKSDIHIIMTDSMERSEETVKMLCGALNGKTVFVRWREPYMRTSYKKDDVILLLKDVTGKLTPLPASKREPLIQSGIHYSELLPAEYKPSGEYIELYEKGLSYWASFCAEAVGKAAQAIYNKSGNKTALVSLARAGTPIGVLIKRYIKLKYGADIAHYSISIIRGRGIDHNALKYILARHKSENIQFVDGWTGKGAIVKQLKAALTEYPDIDPSPCVLCDPACLCDIAGSYEDLFIPCSCLNGIVSGLFSRTVLRDDIIKIGDFHGSAYLEEFSDLDKTYEFIERVESEFKLYDMPIPKKPENNGTEEIKTIMNKFGVSDINFIKPGIGETTRALLRRVPRLVLLRDPESDMTKHIVKLAAEKNVKITAYPLKNYRACAVIGNIEDI